MKFAAGLLILFLDMKKMMSCVSKLGLVLINWRKKKEITEPSTVLNPGLETKRKKKRELKINFDNIFFSK